MTAARKKMAQFSYYWHVSNFSKSSKISSEERICCTWQKTFGKEASMIGNNASVFRMDSRFCTGVLGTYHRQCLLLQNVLFPGGRKINQKKYNIKKYTNDTAKWSPRLWATKVPIYLLGDCPQSNASVLRMFIEREDWVMLALAGAKPPLTPTPTIPTLLWLLRLL